MRRGRRAGPILPCTISISLLGRGEHISFTRMPTQLDENINLCISIPDVNVGFNTEWISYLNRLQIKERLSQTSAASTKIGTSDRPVSRLIHHSKSAVLSVCGCLMSLRCAYYIPLHKYDIAYLSVVVLGHMHFYTLYPESSISGSPKFLLSRYSDPPKLLSTVKSRRTPPLPSHGFP